MDDDIEEVVTEAEDREERPQEIEIPDDFDNEDDFVDYIRETREEDASADEENRERGLEDLQFAGGFQWREEDLQWRRENKIPTLTINRYPAFLQQRIGARMRSRVGPRVDPETVGEKYEDIAKIRQGLLRGIERFSRAHVAYDRCYQNILTAGVGNFYVRLDYATDDVFDQDIRIDEIFNPFAVVWDRLSTDPTGRDARHCSVEDLIPKKEFEALYPWARVVSVDDVANIIPMQFHSRRFVSEWLLTDAIRVAHFWRMRVRHRVLALMTDGDVVDVTEIPNPADYARPIQNGEGVATVVRHPQTGRPIIRNSPMRYAEMYITNGVELLEGPFHLPITRLPVIRASGWQLPIGDQLQRYSMVAFGKDPMRFHNYVRSDRAERILNRPKALWKATEEQVSGHEAEWNNSHTTRNRLLVYNGDAGGSPEMIEPPPVDAAAMMEAQASVQDIMDVFNMHEASLGQQSNEVSRVAIDARAGISELGAVIFDENMNYAQQEGYEVANQLIQYAYDTPRMVKILGEDDNLRDAILNDPENPESVDVTLGKYSITLEIGPSYASRRMFAVESLNNIINSVPGSAEIVFDKLIEAQGIPGADIIAERWRKRFGINDDDEPDPAQAALAAQQQQMALEAQRIEFEQAQAELEKTRAEVAETLAQVREREVDTSKREAEMVARLEEADARVRESNAKIELIEAQIARLNATPIPTQTGEANG